MAASTGLRTREPCPQAARRGGPHKGACPTDPTGAGGEAQLADAGAGVLVLELLDVPLPDVLLALSEDDVLVVLLDEVLALLLDELPERLSLR